MQNDYQIKKKLCIEGEVNCSFDTKLLTGRT